MDIQSELKKIDRLVKIASPPVVLATNDANWSWEYDSHDVIAKITADDSGRLRLNITSVHVKSGLGKGTRKEVLEDTNVGDIHKPKLSTVRSLLKKHNIKRGRMAYGFKKRWESIWDAPNDSSPLGVIIAKYAASLAPEESESQPEQMSRSEMAQRVVEKMQGMSTSQIERLMRHLGI